MNQRLQGPPPEIAGAVLTIDLSAVGENWRRLAKEARPAECGAAVKGDAYGLGIAPVACALWEAGCRSYFVARPMEGGELRAILPREAVIYVLDGLFSGQAEYYAKEDLRPCLIAREEAVEWAEFGARYGRALPCALHVDTGINRLGFAIDDYVALVADRAFMTRLDVALFMSHLACADDRYDPLNVKQRDAFDRARSHLPGVPTSFANSSGIFLGKAYRGDLVRPGIALWGGNPTPDAANPMTTVVRLDAAVLQVRDVAPGETVGYGATWRARRPTRIAVLGAGYKDGIPRHLSSTRQDGPAQVVIRGKRCPVVGRISMDMMAVDVTGVDATRDDRAELLGDNISIDEAAGWAGTICYELITRLGQRYARLYRGHQAPAREAAA
jgi:alanine racemase